MRRWFHKYFLYTKQLTRDYPQLKHFIFKHHIWKLRCDTVARGVAIGAFVAFIPLPIQSVLAIVLSTLIKGNIVIAVAITWISNPITFAPIVYLTYKIGNLVLGTNENIESIPALHIEFDSFSHFFSSSYDWLAHFGKAYFIGLPVTAISFAMIGYISVIIIWKMCVLFGSANKK